MNITAIMSENSTNENRLFVIFSKHGRCYNATVARLGDMLVNGEPTIDADVATIRFANADDGNAFYKLLKADEKFVKAECSDKEWLKSIVRYGISMGCKTLASAC